MSQWPCGFKGYLRVESIGFAYSKLISLVRNTRKIQWSSMAVRIYPIAQIDSVDATW